MLLSEEQLKEKMLRAKNALEKSGWRKELHHFVEFKLERGYHSNIMSRKIPPYVQEIPFVGSAQHMTGE